MMNFSDFLNISDHGKECVEKVNAKELQHEDLESEVRFWLEGVLLSVVGVVGIFGEQ